MRCIDRRFDAIVIGSGAGGTVAVKELTERRLDVLLLEVDRSLNLPAEVEPVRCCLDLIAKTVMKGEL